MDSRGWEEPPKVRWPPTLWHVCESARVRENGKGPKRTDRTDGDNPTCEACGVPDFVLTELRCSRCIQLRSVLTTHTLSFFFFFFQTVNQLCYNNILRPLPFTLVIAWFYFLIPLLNLNHIFSLFIITSNCVKKLVQYIKFFYDVLVCWCILPSILTNFFFKIIFYTSLFDLLHIKSVFFFILNVILL